MDRDEVEVHKHAKKKNLTNIKQAAGLALWAERQPRISPAIYTALLDRLAIVNRHIIAWIGWVPSIP